MSYESSDKKTWSEKITEGFNALMTKLDLPEDMRHEIETFVLDVAKNQYMIGNKSGISWLRKQVGAKPGQVLTAIDAPQPAAGA